MRLDDLPAVTDAEIEHSARREHAVDVGDDGFGVGDVLIDVFEDNDIHGAVLERQVLTAGDLEVDWVTETLAHLGQTRFIDVDTLGLCPGQRELVGDGPSGAPDIDRLQTRERTALVGGRTTQPVGDDGDELGGPLAARLLVEHLVHQLGVGRLLLAWLRIAHDRDPSAACR